MTDPKIWDSNEIRAHELSQSFGGERFPFFGAFLAITAGAIFTAYSTGHLELWSAQSLTDEKDQVAKAKQLDMSLAMNPKLEAARYERASLRFNLDEPDLEGARTDIEAAINVAPNSIHDLQLEAAIEVAAREYNAAINVETKLIALDPDGRQTYFSTRADLYDVLGQNANAAADRNTVIDLCTNSISHDPNNKTKFAERAGQYLLLGQVENAIQDYEKAEDNSSNLLHLAKIFESTGRDNQACEIYAKLYSRGTKYDFNPDEALAQLAAIHLKTKEYGKALIEIERLLQHGKTDERLAAHAYVLEKLGRYADAETERRSTEENLSILVERELKDPDPNVRIYAAIDFGLRGDFYMAAGEYEKAAKDYEDAIARLDPSCRDFEFKCGHARLKAGDCDSAIRHFSKILSASDKLTKKDQPDYEKERAYNGLAQVHLRQTSQS